MTQPSKSPGKDADNRRVPGDASDADIAEQQQPWAEAEEEPRPVIPPDAPEADVLDQNRPADLDEDDRDAGG